jgi:hypothetical protein
MPKLYLYIIINPLISFQAKKTNLRKVKTDIADAYQLGELFGTRVYGGVRGRGLVTLSYSIDSVTGTPGEVYSQR